MHPRGGRQFSRGGNYVGGGRRRFRGQYVRSQPSPTRHQDRDEQSMGPPPTSSSTNQNQYQPRVQQQQQHRNSNSTLQQDFEEIKDLCSKLNQELSQVKLSIDSMAVSLEQIHQQQHQLLAASGQQPLAPAPPPATSQLGQQTAAEKRRKSKLLRKRDGKFDQALAPNSSTLASNEKLAAAPLNKDPRNVIDKRARINRREYQDKPTTAKTLPRPNDDSTTQAADPSSEDKVDGEDGGPERVRVFRRKKQHFGRRGFYKNRRRHRGDSSERNSNDTSPQNEANGDYYRPKTKNNNQRNNSTAQPKRTFPELSEAELSKYIQNLKRDFFAADINSIRKTIDEKGPVVAQEFASAILDHAMCDVTSPTKLSDIANNLFQILVSDDGGVEFQQGFYSALTAISKREDDIAIDAPRYMDTLGQVLGQCVVPMFRHKQLLKRFLNKSLQSYGQDNRALLLASTMRGIAGHKSDRFAKEVWDVANLKWENFLNEGSELVDFLESQDVKFTTQRFSPEPRKTKKTPEELEKFADDITNLVEKKSSNQALNEMIRDLELEPDELVDYLGVFIYAIVRGCLVTDSGDYKLNAEALDKYSNTLKGKHHYAEFHQASEHRDAIALHALTALTKLWHQYNCPQDLMRTMLLTLHNHGAASYDALKTWLNSEDLKNIPGIGAARLNSKRCIEDLGASRG